MKTVPDKCPFCESPVRVHCGNPLRSDDGGFATYECRTQIDVEWDDDQWRRVGQSDLCRIREVQLLRNRIDEASTHIKLLEDVGDEMCSEFKAFCPLGSKTRHKWRKARKAKP